MNAVALARAGHDQWSREHTLEIMAIDYRRVLAAAAARPAPRPSGLPAHFIEDHSEVAHRIARQFGADLDLHLWDVEEGREVRSFTGHLREPMCLAISGDSKHALSGGRDKIIRMWELKSGKAGKGGKVKSRKQAVAIALNEARKSGARIPRKKSSSKKKAK